MDTNKYYEKLKSIPYPDRPKKPNFPKAISISEELRNYANEVDVFTNEWLENHKVFTEKQGEVYAEFKVELLKELDIENNPKAELLYSIAWDKGHSGGLCDIWSEACDLVDLIKEGK
jgi:hypothetical protein